MKSRMHAPPKLPEGKVEWQAAADAAEMLLTLAAGQDYGLVDRKLPINVPLCKELLLKAAENGINPRPGPATNGSLLASIRYPESDDAVRAMIEWRKLGNGAFSLPVRIQRVAGIVKDARAVVQYRGQATMRPTAEIRVNTSSLQIHLAGNDGWYSIDLVALVESVARVEEQPLD